METLNWQRQKSYKAASRSRHSLYAVYSPAEKRFLYIGKAACFCGSPKSRYNASYRWLIEYLLESGNELFTAKLKNFNLATGYEQTLIREWNPKYNRDRKPTRSLPVNLNFPW